MKSKKVVYPVIVGLAAILVIAISNLYLKPAEKDALSNPETQKPQTKPTSTDSASSKSSEVKTYKQQVIMSIPFDVGTKKQAIVIPKDPKKYGLVKEGYEAEERGPTSIAVDKQENVYVLDSVASRIKKYNKNGKFIKNIPSPLPDPNDIAVDDDGNLYVQDDGSYSVLKIDQGGKVLLEYPLPEEISPRGATSLHLIEIINGILYGICSFDKSWNSNIFELGIKGLREGESACFKIGTTKKPFNSKQQVNSIKAGIPGEDENIYDWYRRKDDRIVYFSPSNKSIPKTIFKYVDYKLVAGSQETIIDRMGNIYAPYGYVNKNSVNFIIRKYSKGQLIAEAIIPSFASAYQWKKFVAVSNSGNIYFLYAYVSNKDYSEGVRIIKCTLK